MPVGDDPERDERKQREPGDAPQGDDDTQERHRSAIVGATVVCAPATHRCQPRQPRQLPGDEHRRDEHGHHRQQPSDETEPDDQLSGRERPHGIAGVTADVEVGHPTRPFGAARVGRELRALGMKCRNPETTDEDEHDDDRIHRGDRRSADTDGGEHDPSGDQPQHSTAVRPQPEQGLHERGRHRDRQEQHSRQRVAEIEACGEERNHRRHASRREVGSEMAARQRQHRTSLDSPSRRPGHRTMVLARVAPPRQ